ncbi:hypothetical protein FOZ62_023952 [Perkinsus olseni]|uniref:Uncharacterized protein n=1 Tax=Perkinsus olseni TaxID=32597 RepID=A0A7J6TBN5_PEROL|nr:hypothetical protein FOZ62_023952 [Perkinsus olseni]
MHRLVTASNFPICPAGSDSVVLKFLAKRGVYFDVRLPLTVPEDGFGKIKPGRYLMLKNGSNRFENLVDMEVDIAEEALGKQTADLIFSHKNGEKFIINHLNLTRGHRSSRLASGLGKDIEDRCFGLDRGGRILGSKIEKFKCISKAFGGDLQTLRGRNAAICVIDDYSIIFTFPDTRTGPIRIREVNLLLDFGNLHMLGDTSRRAQGLARIEPHVIDVMYLILAAELNSAQRDVGIADL